MWRVKTSSLGKCFFRGTNGRIYQYFRNDANQSKWWQYLPYGGTGNGEARSRLLSGEQFDGSLESLETQTDIYQVIAKIITIKFVFRTRRPRCPN